MLSFLKGFAAFLDYRYWFNPNPVPLGPSLVSGILAFFGWFLFLAIVLYFVARSLKKRDGLKAEVFRRFAGLLFMTGCAGLVALFLAYEQIPFLGMRLWFLATFLYFIIKLGFVTVYAVREYPARRSQVVARERLERWLPQKHKK
ncbi:MAG: hypothetical protein PHT12_04100 [Patescibacteria group bacterium]|nr:hypothetical protein [Patescibacteria group bacterium]